MFMIAAGPRIYYLPVCVVIVSCLMMGLGFSGIPTAMALPFVSCSDKKDDLDSEKISLKKARAMSDRLSKELAELRSQFEQETDADAMETISKEIADKKMAIESQEISTSRHEDIFVSENAEYKESCTYAEQ